MSNEEFEELFGNVPFENIEKIKEYINKNFVSKDKIREKIKEINEEFETNNSSGIYGSDYYIASEQYAFCEEILKELLED